MTTLSTQSAYPRIQMRIPSIHRLLGEGYGKSLWPDCRPETARALAVAAYAHRDQTRHGGAAYIEHPVAVAQAVGMYDSRRSPTFDRFGQMRKQVQAALLHDVVEDTEITLEDLAELFDSDVVRMVKALTNVDKSFGNRKARKAENNRRLAAAGSDVHTIKAYDSAHNMSTSRDLNPGFRRLYLTETHEMLKHIHLASIQAWGSAVNALRESIHNYNIEDAQGHPKLHLNLAPLLRCGACQSLQIEVEVHHDHRVDLWVPEEGGLAQTDQSSQVGAYVSAYCTKCGGEVLLGQTEQEWFQEYIAGLAPKPCLTS